MNENDKAPVAPAWYEFDRIFPYRDLLLMVGFLLVVAGVCFLSVPAGLIVAGIGLIAFGWLLGRSA